MHNPISIVSLLEPKSLAPWRRPTHLRSDGCRNVVAVRSGQRRPAPVGAIYADFKDGSAGKGAPPRPIDRIRPQLTGRGEDAATGAARRRWGRRTRAAGVERTRTAGFHGERRARGAGRRCGALFFCVVAVGDERVWVRYSFVFVDPNAKMSIRFAFHLLDIVL